MGLTARLAARLCPGYELPRPRLRKRGTSLTKEHRMKLFLIALWAYLKANPNATFEEFQMAAERAARLARWPS